MEDIRKLPEVLRELYHRSNVVHPTRYELRQMAEAHGIKTNFGNFAWSTSVRNRSADATVSLGSQEVQDTDLKDKQKEIVKNLPKTLKQVHEYIKKAPFVCVERTMGDNDEFTPHCTMFVSTQRRDSVRIAHIWCNTNFELRENSLPKLYLLHIPEWQEKDRQALVFPEVGVTYVLGSDYHGEAKKGFLRMAMWFAKKKGMLGLHAGTKILHARNSDSNIKTYGMLLLGLSATGKTTHSCHNHGLINNGEKVEILQDDFVCWKRDGSALGTESGFFLKTDSINPDTQPLLYHAATQRDAVFENVMVDYLGNVHFQDETLTGNGRGVVQREDFGEYAYPSINLPPLKELDGLIVAFITRRNTVLPIVSKLTPEQAAAAFMLGESVESSAGDPRKAGQSVRVVGTNPFIIGDKAEEGNIFYDFVKGHADKIQCYLLNTGGVGEIREKDKEGNSIVKRKVLRVAIPEMASLIRGIARGAIEWVEEPYFGTMVPKKVEGVDLSKFDLSRFYAQDQIANYVKELRRERIEYMEKFSGLDPAIVNAVKY